jgi:hypothetical protein
VLNENPIFNHFLFLFRFMGGVGRHAQSKVHGTAQGRSVHFCNHPCTQSWIRIRMNPHVSLVGLIRIRIWNGSGMFIPDFDFCPKSNKRGVEKNFSAFFVATNYVILNW